MHASPPPRRRLASSRPPLLFAAFAITFAIAWAAVSSGAGTDGQASIASAAPPAQAGPVDAVPGELIVSFAPAIGGAAGQAALLVAGAKQIRPLRMPDHSLVRVPAGREAEFTSRLLATSGVVAVEPNLIRHITFDPNDPIYWLQWHLTAIGMPTAWDQATGAGVLP